MKLLLALIALVKASSITDCHAHGSVHYCINTDGFEGLISPAPTGTPPKSYTGCHNHGSETYCLNGDAEVLFAGPTDSATNSAANSGATATASGDDSKITGCHFHGSTQFCINNEGVEGSIVPAPTKTDNAPSEYTGCHSHGSDTFCLDNKGNEVQFAGESTTTSTGESSGEMDCHFHAGVEHCVPKGGGENHGHEKQLCDAVERDYNIPLRIGLIFAVLAADFVGVWGPLLVKRFFKNALEGIAVTLIKQFGTGVILSTALVHLMTHAQLMWNNKCITVKYESTSTAITMAGIFVSFVVEFIMHRILLSRKQKLDNVSGDSDSVSDKAVVSEKQTTDHHSLETAETLTSEKAKHDKVALMLLEAGIVFHSVLIGVTLVVAGDSYFITLFIVILFHQFFEGVALGTRIAEVTSLATWKKLVMGAVFAVTTPVGMAIGTGVLNSFNGNDFSTIVALGTLDAFSAGILLWVGLIEMLAHDWLHGKLATANWWHVLVGFFGLVAGMVLMSFIGKWA